MVAVGMAEIYPSLSPSMEWDIAITDVIVLESGKKTYKHKKQKEQIIYNKKNLLNTWFMVM